MNTLNSGSYIPSIQLCTHTQMQRLPNVHKPSKVDTYFLARPTLHVHMISHDMTGQDAQHSEILNKFLHDWCGEQKFMSVQLQAKIYAWALFSPVLSNLGEFLLGSIPA